MDITKFTTGEDILNEKELKELKARYKFEMTRHSELEPERIYNVLYAYHLIGKMMNNSNVTAKISYEFADSPRDYTTVNITGKNLMFNDPDLFARAIDLAALVHIDLIDERTVQISLFYDSIRYVKNDKIEETKDRTFDEILRTINKVNKNFSATHKMNEEKLEDIRRYSLALDEINKEIKSSCFAIGINEDDKTIIASIETECAFIEKCIQIYRDLIGSTVSFGVVPIEGDMLSIVFVFPGIWE